MPFATIWFFSERVSPMVSLEFVRSRIPAYAGYANWDARHLVDRQIRAYLGEALAAAGDRLRPSGVLADHLDGLLVRCQFADQRGIRALEHAHFDEALLERVHAFDRAVVEAAERLDAATEAEALGTALSGAGRALDRRSGALVNAAPPR
jgi:hypothetical protein